MGQKAVFLDRDGVINDNVRPINKPDDLILFPGVGAAVKRLQDAGYRVFVVTNQGGVGLGYMTEEDLRSVHDKMIRELSRDGAVIDDIRYCSHRPHAGCGCRKPEPGMILELASKYNIDLDQSFMVGDRDFDIQAGRRAGTRTVFIGKGHADADLVAKDLTEAVNQILNQGVMNR
ncbi:D-glycero-alpha-D-manno-heptose-1,7-bisphosphate 7-phosphatase [Effusibacillus lacus]|uniref:D,D-heptose 1,7-bisphosphate phosphatase n=1 Tax=Effusibacillus lacus TaxID=1348429 RepID=A0A292YKF9_9BACL|nr:HAD family hydrolase [Effusibacillus lacus]TCS74926.1 D-glycero-D-manno-heptose 1,7-bisphosphate phosphatase [Effusibacillus lacus]GAX91597.1 D-glycero-beta-D-manno-heptose-1,7-bisphosphate 7-phosphatase [Effusibacillus lacus]